MEKIDLSDKVRVVLTQRGADILNKANEKMSGYYPGLIFKTDYKESDSFEGLFWTVVGSFKNEFAKDCEAPFRELEKI